MLRFEVTRMSADARKGKGDEREPTVYQECLPSLALLALLSGTAYDSFRLWIRVGCYLVYCFVHVTLRAIAATVRASNNGRNKWRTA